MPFPRIIRLIKYIKIKLTYREEPWTKGGVLRRDGWICCYCGKAGADSVEHILPISRGGEFRSWTNTAACHYYPCNAKKGSKTLEEAGMKLKYELTVPMKFRKISKK